MIETNFGGKTAITTILHPSVKTYLLDTFKRTFYAHFIMYFPLTVS